VTYTRDVLAKWLRIGANGSGATLSGPEQYGRGLRNYTDSAHGYTLIEVQGAGHFNLLERPNFWDPLNDLIASFDEDGDDE
jgi:pimeloyl-ACP methyl ester carboxylesterase